jgi:endonuclease/exonuclease/phosphatase family metal-dependent hydrolase
VTTRSLRKVRGIGVLGAVVTLLVCLIGPSGAARADDGTEGERLRVATYNIHHGAGPDDVLDLRHTAKVLALMRADLIGLQEVDRHWSERSEFLDEAQWLGSELNMHVAYAANLDLDPAAPGQERRQYGTAVLSRYPIQSSTNTFLPKFGDHEQRGLLVTTISVHGVKIRFANTHLQHNDNLEREAQAAAIVDLLGDSPTRTILVGDLNATPDVPEIKTLTDVFGDAWAEVGVGDGFTIPVDNPDRRIDYVLGSSDVTFRQARVPSTDASDHLPVVVDLTVG